MPKSDVLSRVDHTRDVPFAEGSISVGLLSGTIDLRGKLIKASASSSSGINKREYEICQKTGVPFVLPRYLGLFVCSMAS